MSGVSFSVLDHTRPTSAADRPQSAAPRRAPPSEDVALARGGPGALEEVVEVAEDDGASEVEEIHRETQWCRQGLEQDTAWAQEALVAANAARATHYAPPLEWSNQMADWARIAADQVVARGTPAPPVGYGQTVVGGAEDWPARRVVETWHAEGEAYDYEDPGPNEFAAGFTQLVWAATTHFGMARDSAGAGVVVAIYFPPGNQPFEFGLMVLPRRIPRTMPLHAHRAATMDPDTRSVLEAIRDPHPDLAERARRHLLTGKQVELTYLPPPAGSVMVTFFSRGLEPTTVTRPI